MRQINETTINHMMTITSAKKPTMEKKVTLLLGKTDKTTMSHIIINTACSKAAKNEKVLY